MKGNLSMDTNSSSKKTNWIQLASFVLIILLGVETVLLILQNRQLKATLQAMMASAVEPLKPGEKIEPVKVETLDGATIDLGFADPTKQYLLCIFSTTCPHCEKTMPVWSQIAHNADEKKLTIIGISTFALEETKKYVSEKKPGFYVVSAGGDTSFSRKFKISGVPETILVKGNGIVVKAWIGELQSGQIEEIQTLLSASQALR